MPTTERAQLVQDLAKSHFTVEPGLEVVAWVPSGPADEIRLIEVNRDTFPSPDLSPIRFSRTGDIPYFCVICEVTPGEWHEISEGRRQLPTGWEASPGDLVVIPRPQG